LRYITKSDRLCFHGKTKTEVNDKNSGNELPSGVSYGSPIAVFPKVQLDAAFWQNIIM
jgi:hypothetical protein